MSDNINELPVDQTIPTNTEIHILDTLFKQKMTAMQKFLNGTKDILVMGFLFVLFSLPQIDELIQKFIPITSTSLYILIFIKALFFMGLYFVLKNIYLVKK